MLWTICTAREVYFKLNCLEQILPVSKYWTSLCLTGAPRWPLRPRVLTVNVNGTARPCDEEDLEDDQQRLALLSWGKSWDLILVDTLGFSSFFSIMGSKYIPDVRHLSPPFSGMGGHKWRKSAGEVHFTPFFLFFSSKLELFCKWKSLWLYMILWDVKRFFENLAVSILPRPPHKMG